MRRAKLRRAQAVLLDLHHQELVTNKPISERRSSPVKDSISTIRHLHRHPYISLFLSTTLPSPSPIFHHSPPLSIPTSPPSPQSPQSLLTTCMQITHDGPSDSCRLHSRSGKGLAAWPRSQRSPRASSGPSWPRRS